MSTVTVLFTEFNFVLSKQSISGAQSLDRAPEILLWVDYFTRATSLLAVFSAVPESAT